MSLIIAAALWSKGIQVNLLKRTILESRNPPIKIDFVNPIAFYANWQQNKTKKNSLEKNDKVKKKSLSCMWIYNTKWNPKETSFDMITERNIIQDAIG